MLGIVLVLVLAGGGVGLFLWQRSRTDASSSAVSTTQSAQVATTGSGAGGAQLGGASRAPAQTTAPSAGVPAPVPSQPAPGQGDMTEQQALTYLAELRAESLQRVVLDGRWVAQVASKNVGITDPLQTTLNGSHTFYALDILAESLSVDGTVSDPNDVYVLWGTDFGKRSQAADGSPYWTTLVDAGFASHDNVLAWCQVSFPSLTPQQLNDTCVPRQLTQPHG